MVFYEQKLNFLNLELQVLKKKANYQKKEVTKEKCNIMYKS